MQRGLFFLILLAILSSEGRSEPPTDAGTHAATPLRQLMTGDDSRGWQAVGRLNIGARAFCTGALIAEDLVLTAAHCLYDAETGQRIGADEIEFLADWRGGRASAYRGVRRALTHPDFVYDGTRPVTRVAHDVAILELDHPIRNTTIAPFPTQARAGAGTEVGVVSYAHDRADSPALQELCHVLARQGGALILSCDVDFGSSGAPVFVVDKGRAHIVSLVSAKAELSGRPVALGVNLAGPLADLMALHAEGDGVFDRPKPVVRRLDPGQARAGTGAKFLRP